MGEDALMWVRQPRREPHCVGMQAVRGAGCGQSPCLPLIPAMSLKLLENKVFKYTTFKISHKGPQEALTDS